MCNFVLIEPYIVCRWTCC